MFNKQFSFFLLFLTLSLSLEAQLVKDGLHAYYPFSNDFLDYSGNGYHGQNNFSNWSEDHFGNPDQALEFNYHTSVDFGDVMDDVFVGEDKQFSISVWIRPAALMSNSVIIVKNGDAACGQNQRQWVLKLFADQKLNFTYQSSLTGGNARRILSRTRLNEDRWYFITLLYDGTKDSNNGKDRVRMFIDCQEEETILDGATGIFNNIKNGNARLSIGDVLTDSGTPCGNNFSFKGQIDEVYIFDRLLTTDEISLLGKPLEDDLSLGADTTICVIEANFVADEYLIDPMLPAGTTMLWSDGSTGPTLLVDQSGTYWVEVGDFCTMRDTINVEFKECTGVATEELEDNCEWRAAGLVKPTEPGTFQDFWMHTECEFADWHLQIYSVSGRKVFEAKEQQLYGIQRIPLQNLPAGVYFYQVVYKNRLNEYAKGIKRGNFVLVKDLDRA